MNITSKWKFRSLGVKIMLGLVVTLLISSVNVAPASADNDHDRDRKGKHYYRSYDNRGRGYYRGQHDRRYRREYRQYGYRERVYVAPPVVYAPPPPPGISIMFPPIFFRP